MLANKYAGAGGHLALWRITLPRVTVPFPNFEGLHLRLAWSKFSNVSALPLLSYFVASSVSVSPKKAIYNELGLDKAQALMRISSLPSQTTGAVIAGWNSDRQPHCTKLPTAKVSWLLPGNVPIMALTVNCWLVQWAERAIHSLLWVLLLAFTRFFTGFFLL